MKVIQTILTELIGLLVDDWAFAGLILVWVALFLPPAHRTLGAWGGPALFAGLAVLVLGFVVRKARS
jgi:hypothetical protein